MHTLMQAVDEQFTRYPVDKMSNRQKEDLHTAAWLANKMAIARAKIKQVLGQ